MSTSCTPDMDQQDPWELRSRRYHIDRQLSNRPGNCTCAGAKNGDVARLKPTAPLLHRGAHSVTVNAVALWCHLELYESRRGFGAPRVRLMRGFRNWLHSINTREQHMQHMCTLNPAMDWTYFSGFHPSCSEQPHAL